MLRTPRSRRCWSSWPGSSGVGRLEALALASVAVDLRVTQVVNESKGVHAVLRDDALRIGRAA